MQHRLREGLKDLNGLLLPVVSKECTHVYYVFGMILNNNSTANKRDLIFSALKAEGVPALNAGYQNIHLNPLFKNRIAYGTKSFPWKGLERGASKIFIKKVLVL